MNVVVVCPVYNDWLSLKRLISDISSIQDTRIIKVVAVDDASTQSFNSSIDYNGKLELVRLNQNLGHQRAIAIGLCHVFENIRDVDYVCVMDSDGEDDPLEIANMINCSIANKRIVFAARKKRHEGAIFKSLYLVYKFSYKLLVGKVHDFGNFCIIPIEYLSSVVSLSSIWNHFSGAIIKSRIPYERFAVNKAPRYEGTSKMNLISLVLHGLSALSINLDIIVVRILLFSGILAGTILHLTLIIVIMRIFTDFFVPGWASTVLVLLVILFMGVMGISILTVLLVLLNRNTIKRPPIKYYKDFIKSTQES